MLANALLNEKFVETGVGFTEICDVVSETVFVSLEVVHGVRDANDKLPAAVDDVLVVFEASVDDVKFSGNAEEAVLSPSPLRDNEKPEPNPVPNIDDVVVAGELPKLLKTEAVVVVTAGASVFVVNELKLPNGLAVFGVPKENPFEVSPAPERSAVKFGVADGAFDGSSFLSASLNVKDVFSVLLSSSFFSTTRGCSFCPDGETLFAKGIEKVADTAILVSPMVDGVFVAFSAVLCATGLM